MTEVTRWARNGEANIAYRTLGDGPIDLVLLTGLSHIEVILEEPGLRRCFDRLAQIARVILIDRRGTGLSDPLPDGLTLEQEADDVAAVLDAVGSDRAVLQAYAVGGPLAVVFAHRRPERTPALVLYACIARVLGDEDGYAFAPTREERRERIEELAKGWGGGGLLPGHLRRPAVAGRALRAGDHRERPRPRPGGPGGPAHGRVRAHGRRRRRHGGAHRRARQRLAAPGEVLVSGTVYGTVVGSGLEFAERGMHALKGVPGQWPLFALDC